MEATAEIAAPTTTPTTPTTPKARAPFDPLGRLARELSTLEKQALDAAKKRLAGTRAEGLFDRVPAKLEGEVDALLARVGLVRKATLDKPVSPDDAKGDSSSADAAAPADGIVEVAAETTAAPADAPADADPAVAQEAAQATKRRNKR
jgi:hypothetical protein